MSITRFRAIHNLHLHGFNLVTSYEIENGVSHLVAKVAASRMLANEKIREKILQTIENYGDQANKLRESCMIKDLING